MRGLAPVNIGSGQRFTIREVAARMASALGKEALGVELTQKFRVGDIRRCLADISFARQVLGYAPRVSFEAGLGELVEWLSGQSAVDRVGQARVELAVRGLSV